MRRTSGIVLGRDRRSGSSSLRGRSVLDTSERRSPYNQRTVEVLRGASEREPQALIDCLRDAVLSYARELKDDLQILVLRRTD